MFDLFEAFIQRVALQPFSFLSPNSMCSDDVYESDSAHKDRNAWHKCHQRKVAQRKRRRPCAAGYTHGTDRGGGAGEDDDVTMETNPHAEIHHATTTYGVHEIRYADLRKIRYANSYEIDCEDEAQHVPDDVRVLQGPATALSTSLDQRTTTLALFIAFLVCLRTLGN